MLGMRPCHSERSEESRASDHSALRSTRGILRVGVLPASLDCQDASAAVALLGILRRCAPQNDSHRALCHSERSEESRASDSLSAQVYPQGILRVGVLPANLDCQDASAAVKHCLGFFVVALLRMTNRNSVILNAVKNPEPQITQRSGLHKGFSGSAYYLRTLIVRMQAQQSSTAWDSSSLRSSE